MALETAPDDETEIADLAAKGVTRVSDHGGSTGKPPAAASRHDEPETQPGTLPRDPEGRAGCAHA
jgi:hypothetical protein